MTSRSADCDSSPARSGCPLATLFAIPKPFVGHVGRIQQNALASWKALAPEIDVLLIGDDAGVAQAADRQNIRHVPNVRRNEHGTPLVDSAFELARQHATSPLLVYCNADVIFLDDFRQAIQRLHAQARCPRFVAIGRRTDLDVETQLDFDDPRTGEELRQRALDQGTPASNACKEYFVFPRTVYADIPAFAVGRGNWDNWMVHSAKRAGIPVIGLTPCVLAIHQRHDYEHLGGNRMDGYVTGAEARENQRLAGGRHLISGSTPTWSLESGGLVPKYTGFFSLELWRDIPRFLRLMASLLRSRRKRSFLHRN